MMKVLPFKSLFFALALIPLVAMGHMDSDKLNGRYTKEKTIKKEYNVNPDALFKVKNSYGNVTLTSWNENRVEIEVHIKTNGNDEDRVQERLDEIDVEFETVPIWSLPLPGSEIVAIAGAGAGEDGKKSAYRSTIP